MTNAPAPVFGIANENIKIAVSERIKADFARIAHLQGMTASEAGRYALATYLYGPEAVVALMQARVYGHPAPDPALAEHWQDMEWAIANSASLGAMKKA